MTATSAQRDLEARLSREGDAAKRMDMIDDALRPPEPQLLDTCVLQNLDWVNRMRQAGEDDWTEGREVELQQQFGVDLANDLLDLGTLYVRFEDDGGYPWLVSNAAVDEATVLQGAKGNTVRSLI